MIESQIRHALRALAQAQHNRALPRAVPQRARELVGAGA